ncbi:MAG: ABC transporter ATP-binding protein [candidate division WOR-3 bacterium]
MSELLIAKGITKVYRGPHEELTVLNGLDLTVNFGEFVGITGPSGSGKTTLLNILGTLDVPTSGEVRLGQKAYSSMSDQELSDFRANEIGFIFQFHHLLPDLTALENVMLPGLLTKRPKKEIAERAIALLEAVGIAERAHHIPKELSGGESQRVAIARALVNNPSLVLADEPTGNLDKASGLKLMELLSSLNRIQSLTIIMVTHNEAFIPFFTNSYRLEDGRLRPVK